MSKIRKASCVSDIVSIDSKVVIGAEIFSDGMGESEGLLIQDEVNTFYFASNASDIKTLLTKLIDIVGKTNAILTNIGLGMTGPTTAPPPTLAADLLAIDAIKSELNILKENLK